MMRRNRMAVFACLVIASFCHTNGLAPAGSVGGVVVDQQTGEAVVGAVVVSQDTPHGTITYLEGGSSW